VRYLSDIIMVKTNYLLKRLKKYLCCTQPNWLVCFYSDSSLKQQSTGIYVDSLLKQQPTGIHVDSSLKQQSTGIHVDSSLKQQPTGIHVAPLDT
jgi:hypothetical protein